MHLEIYTEYPGMTESRIGENQKRTAKNVDFKEMVPVMCKCLTMADSQREKENDEEVREK